MEHMTKSQMIVKRMGHEMKEDEPSAVAHTREKFGKERAEKQHKAILLSKARRAGAKIPNKYAEAKEAAKAAS